MHLDQLGQVRVSTGAEEIVVPRFLVDSVLKKEQKNQKDFDK